MKMAAAAIILVGYSAGATAQDENDQWQFQITPYVWLPTISADVNFDPPPSGGGGAGGGPSIDVGPTDWLELINGVALINAGVQKGRFSLSTDFVFLSMESEKDRITSVLDNVTIPGNPEPLPIDATLNLATKTDFDGLAWTTVVGYSLRKTETSNIEVLAGARLLDLEATVEWNLTAEVTTPGGDVILPAQGSIAQDKALWDGIIGVRGHFALGEGNWSVPFYVDAGAGDTDLTWQAMAGFTYTYGWGDLMLVFRHLAYDQGDDALFESLSFSGPGVGARFRF
jgi:hypothetical protein